MDAGLCMWMISGITKHEFKFMWAKKIFLDISSNKWKVL